MTGKIKSIVKWNSVSGFDFLVWGLGVFGGLGFFFCMCHEAICALVYFSFSYYSSITSGFPEPMI